MTPPAVPAPRPSFYAYAIVDVSSDPPTPVCVKMSRSEARQQVEHDPDADNLRIRRVRCIQYER